MILLIISAVFFLGGGYVWLKTFVAFRSKKPEERTLIQAEIAGIIIGSAFVGTGVFFLMLALNALSV